MKIVNLIGGLGNQMFQYAFLLSLAKRFPQEVIKANTMAFNGYGKHNAYELDKVFGIAPAIANRTEICKMAYPYFNYKLWQIGYHLLPQRHTMFNGKIFGRYYPEAYAIHGDCYYDGYWQNVNYFKDIRNELLATYTPIELDANNISWGKKMYDSNSISIHVRRGDFLNSPLYKGICELDYYEKAIKEVLDKTNPDTFYIFSNNCEWCKDNIVPLLNGIPHVIIDWNKGADSYKDMYLMSRCHHNIIAHSTFSWWGAWLNQHPDKIVIGPSRWVNIKNNEFDLPTEWIKI